MRTRPTSSAPCPYPVALRSNGSPEPVRQPFPVHTCSTPATSNVVVLDRVRCHTSQRSSSHPIDPGRRGRRLEPVRATVYASCTARKRREALRCCSSRPPAYAISGCDIRTISAGPTAAAQPKPINRRRHPAPRSRALAANPRVHASRAASAYGDQFPAAARTVPRPPSGRPPGWRTRGWRPSPFRLASSTVRSAVSPGITMPVPSNSTAPDTSPVRKWNCGW